MNVDQKEEDKAPDAEDSSIKVPTMMTTADIAMKEDPSYRKISESYYKNPNSLSAAGMPVLFKTSAFDILSLSNSFSISFFFS